jgi:hypothetical protein
VTPDGIETGDWDEVRELAVTIVNLSGAGDDVAGEQARVYLLALLDRLDAKYGPKPSLLATRADYVDSSVARGDCLQRAYAAAKQLSDAKNMVWVASSLASFYIEEINDVRKGAAWLFTLRELLVATPDASEQAEVNRLELLLLKKD